MYHHKRTKNDLTKVIIQKEIQFKKSLTCLNVLHFAVLGSWLLAFKLRSGTVSVTSFSVCLVLTQTKGALGKVVCKAWAGIDISKPPDISVPELYRMCCCWPTLRIYVH